MSELGSSFAQEGGPYEWMKLCYGRLTAGFGAVLYWITNPLWVGGTLCFLASSAFSEYFIHLGGPKISFLGHTPIVDLLFKVAFIWISIVVAIAALDRGKWIPNFGAVCRAFVLLFFSFTVLIYAFKHGINGFGFSDFIPGATSVSGTVIFLGVVPLLLFNYVGFELANGAAEEMVDPQKDVPKSVIRSAIATVILYSLPIFGILVVLPTDKIKGIDGFVGAVNAVFGDVYGGAAHMLVKFMVGAFIVSLVTSGAVWMIGSDRVLAVASYDGAWAPWFGVFNRKFGTPVRVNTMSGVLSTIFLLFALNLLSGSNASSFEVILALTTSTTLLSYVMIFPTGWLLRRRHGHVHRPYKAPFDGRVRHALHGLDGDRLVGRVRARHARARARLLVRLPGHLGRLVRPLRGDLGRHRRPDRTADGGRLRARGTRAGTERGDRARPARGPRRTAPAGGD